MKQEELKVAALKNGTVIDHIPNEKLFQVVNLLHLERMTSAVTVGFQLESPQMGTKSIIKIADKYFSDEELNQLSVITPNVTLCVIRDYEIVEKKTVAMPSNLVGIVRCPNPKCITNNEPMKTKFRALDASHLCCYYCNTQVQLDEVKLAE